MGYPARTAQPGQLPPPRFAIPAAQPNGLSFCSAVGCPAPVEFHPFAQLSGPAVPSTYEFSSVANVWINQAPRQCSGTGARRSRSSGAACCDVTRPEPIGLLAVYTGIRCQPFFARGHTDSSSIRRIETNRPTCMLSGRRQRRSFGWSRSAWRKATVSAGRRSDASKDWSRKTRPLC